jgi:hypothetical protein
MLIWIGTSGGGPRPPEIAFSTAANNMVVELRRCVLLTGTLCLANTHG